jgi:hypothetical protein
MTATIDRVVMRNSVFAWIALATCLVLLIPLVAMQFTTDVNWTVMDFIVMGTLLFGAGAMYVLVARQVPRKYWPAVGVMFAAVVLYLWAQLAVGVFTNWGS